MIKLISIALAALALALAGCGGDDDSDDDGGGTEAAVATESTPEPAGGAQGAGITVKVSDSEYGRILFDDSDQAIYLFDKESGPTSECYGACAEAWPPVLTEGDPQAGSGAQAGLLGTTERDDGSTQVTYKGHPLYYYEDDPKGQVLCHDVEEFGGLWLVVQPNGDAVS